MAELRIPKINKTILSGRIGNDVELKYTPKGTAVLRLNLAVDKSYKGTDGNWVNETSWLDCVAWAKIAEYAAGQIGKGSPVIIEGHIDARTWEAEGKKGKAVEIIIDAIHPLEKRGDNPAPQPEMPEPSPISGDVPF